MKKIILFSIIALCACNQQAKNISPKVSFTLYEKGERAIDKYGEQVKLVFSIGITNNTDKKIGGVIGNLVFRDAETNEVVFGSSYSHDEILLSGATDTVELTAPYNPADMADVAFRYKKKENLTLVWEEDKVVFAE